LSFSERAERKKKSIFGTKKAIEKGKYHRSHGYLLSININHSLCDR